MAQYNATITGYYSNISHSHAVIIDNFDLTALRPPALVLTHTFLSEHTVIQDDDLANVAHATHRCSIVISNTETIHTMLVLDLHVTADAFATPPQLYAYVANTVIGYPTRRPANPISSPSILPAVPPPSSPPAPIACNDPTHATNHCNVPQHVNFIPCTRQHIQVGNTPATNCNLNHTSPADYQVLHDYNAGTLCSVAAHQNPAPGSAACQLPHADQQHDAQVTATATQAAHDAIRAHLTPNEFLNIAPRILSFVYRMNNHSRVNAKSLFPALLTIIDSDIAATLAPTSGTPAPQNITFATVEHALAQVTSIAMPTQQHIGRFLRRTHTNDELATFTARTAHTCTMRTLCPLHALLSFRSTLSPTLQNATSAYEALLQMPQTAASSLEPVSPFYLPTLLAIPDEHFRPYLRSLRQMTLEDILSSV